MSKWTEDTMFDEIYAWARPWSYYPAYFKRIIRSLLRVIAAADTDTDISISFWIKHFRALKIRAWITISFVVPLILVELASLSSLRFDMTHFDLAIPRILAIIMWSYFAYVELVVLVSFKRIEPDFKRIVDWVNKN